MYEELTERYGITPADMEKTKRNFFLSLDPPRLKTYSAKEKNKIMTLILLMPLFENERRYTESEITGILRPVWEDFVTLRRALVDTGLLKREKDGTAYWKP